MLKKMRKLLTRGSNTDGPEKIREKRDKEIWKIESGPRCKDYFRYQWELKDRKNGIQDFNTKYDRILPKIKELRQLVNKYKSVLETNSSSDISMDEYYSIIQRKIERTKQFFDKNKNDLTTSRLLQLPKELDAYYDDLFDKLNKYKIKVLGEAIKTTCAVCDSTYESYQTYINYAKKIMQSKVFQDFKRQHDITLREINNACKHKEYLTKKELLPDTELSLTLQKLTTCQTDLLSTFKPLENCWKALSELHKAQQTTGDTLNKAQKYYKHEKYRQKYAKELSEIEESACFQNLGKTIQKTEHLIKISNDELGKIKTLNEMHKKNNDLSPYPLAVEHFLALSQKLSYGNDQLSNQRAEFQSKIKETIPNLYAEEMLDDLSNKKIINHYTDVNNELYHFLNSITMDPIARRSKEIDDFQGKSLATTLNKEKNVLECIAREQEKDPIQQLRTILQKELERKQKNIDGIAKFINKSETTIAELIEKLKTTTTEPMSKSETTIAELINKLKATVAEPMSKSEATTSELINKLKTTIAESMGKSETIIANKKLIDNIDSQSNLVNSLKNRIQEAKVTIATISQEIYTIEDNKCFFQVFMKIKEIGMNLQLTKREVQDLQLIKKEIPNLSKTIQSDRDANNLEKMLNSLRKKETDLLEKIRLQTREMLAVKNLSFQQEVLDRQLYKNSTNPAGCIYQLAESNLIDLAEARELEIIDGLITSMEDIQKELQRSDDEKSRNDAEYLKLTNNCKYLEKVEKLNNSNIQAFEDNLNKHKDHNRKEANRLRIYSHKLNLYRDEHKKFSKILQLDHMRTLILYDFIHTESIENFLKTHNMENWHNRAKNDYDDQTDIFNERGDLSQMASHNINIFQKNYEKALRANQSEATALNQQEQELEEARKRIHM